MVRVTPEHVDARKRAILEAASAVFARRGSAVATMQEIASEAGLSAGAIYLYYPSKADLVRAVCDLKTIGVQSIFEDARRDSDDPLAILEQVGLTMAAGYGQPDFRNDAILNLETTLAAARDPGDLGQQLSATSCQIGATLTELVRQAQAAGQIDPAVDAERLAVVLEAFAVGLEVTYLRRGGQIDSEGAFATLVDMLRRLSPTSSD